MRELTGARRPADSILLLFSRFSRFRFPRLALVGTLKRERGAEVSFIVGPEERQEGHTFFSPITHQTDDPKDRKEIGLRHEKKSNKR